ncbi:P-loop NTPase [Fibrobacterota bacterium]
MAKLTINEIKKLLCLVEVAQLHENICDLGLVKKVEASTDQVRCNLAIPISLRHLKENLRESCQAVLRNKSGIRPAEIHIAYETRKPKAKNQLTEKMLANLKDVKNLIAVASGKGGVGKSTSAANIAVALGQSGYKTGLMDTDVHRPSLNHLFNIVEGPELAEDDIIHPIVIDGIRLFSMAMLGEGLAGHDWRKPLAPRLARNLLYKVCWGKLDYLFIDLPAGQGAVQSAIMQAAPLTGVIMVTAPHRISLWESEKCLRKFMQVSIPVLGVIENMSYFNCGECGRRQYPFGKGGGERLSESLKVPFYGQIPLDAETAGCGEEGMPVVIKNPKSEISEIFMGMSRKLEHQLKIK